MANGLEGTGQGPVAEGAWNQPLTILAQPPWGYQSAGSLL